MRKSRPLLVIFLIAGLLGCQSNRSVTIDEYRPAKPVDVEQPAPRSEIFSLVRWQPKGLMTPTTQPDPFSKSAPQVSVEVQQVFVDRGGYIGFRRENGQLLAIAGQTVRPIEDAHYEWKTIPNQMNDKSREKWNNFGNAVLTVVLVIVVVGAVYLILRYGSKDDCNN